MRTPDAPAVRAISAALLPVLLLLASACAPNGSSDPPAAVSDQGRPPAASDDVASVDAILDATYEALIRAPGEPFDWERFESMFVRDARLVPNTEQTGGEFKVQTVGEFRKDVDDFYEEFAPIGGPDDKGFAEEGIHTVTLGYGDIALSMSTYSKRFWDDEQILGRGINAMSLVRNGDRWWVVSNAWDEENGAGPLPARYLPPDADPSNVPTGPGAPVRADGPEAADGSTPASIVDELYSTFQRRPGEDIDWEAFAELFLPGALLVPNVEQTGDEFRVFSVDGFRQWIQGIFAEHSPIGSPEDHGLREDGIHSVVERFGDVALVMSTYERHAWDSDEVDGRGVNGISLVRHDGTWRILSIIWDEESGAGPVPARYMP